MSRQTMVLVLGLAMAVTAEAGTTVRTYSTVVSGLSSPTFLTYPPGDSGRLFVLEQEGCIKVVDRATMSVLPTPFLELPAHADGESGLLGLAFHPQYETNGFFYVNYTTWGDVTRIARYHVSDADPNVADASSGTVLLAIQGWAFHYGGWIGFGPDGYLYISVGDAASIPNAQIITDRLNGKVLRLDVDGGPPYAIPPDNPFVNAVGDDEIWAYGLRNPWRCSFDRVKGDLWIADVGTGSQEEINVEEHGSAGGRNYEWSCREGFGSGLGGCSALSASRPVYAYQEDGGRAIVGGYVYRGCSIPDLRGRYVFGDYVRRKVWSGRLVAGVLADVRLEFSVDSHHKILSFGEGPDGELYILTESFLTQQGAVLKIIAEDGGAPTPGDYDSNGMVDLADQRYLAGCLTTPDTDYADCLCDAFDQDFDGDVDLADFVAFQRVFGSTSLPHMQAYDDFAACAAAGGALTVPCQVFDQDRDLDLDLRDFVALQRSMP